MRRSGASAPACRRYRFVADRHELVGDLRVPAQPRLDLRDAVFDREFERPRPGGDRIFGTTNRADARDATRRDQCEQVGIGNVCLDDDVPPGGSSSSAGSTCVADRVRTGPRSASSSRPMLNAKVDPLRITSPATIKGRLLSAARCGHRPGLRRSCGAVLRRPPRGRGRWPRSSSYPVADPACRAPRRANRSR